MKIENFIEGHDLNALLYLSTHSIQQAQVQNSWYSLFANVMMVMFSRTDIVDTFLGDWAPYGPNHATTLVTRNLYFSAIHSNPFS